MNIPSNYDINEVINYYPDLPISECIPFIDKLYAEIAELKQAAEHEAKYYDVMEERNGNLASALIDIANLVNTKATLKELRQGITEAVASVDVI